MAIGTADITPEESIKEQLGVYVMEVGTDFASSSAQGVDRLMNHLSVKQVVDLGAGDGAATKPFVDAGVEVIAVDINQTKLDANPATTVCTDMVSYLKDQPDNSIANIFCHHALEHIPNPEDVLELIAKKLAPGGLVYIEVPNNDGVHSVHHSSFETTDDLLPPGFEAVESQTTDEHYLIARKPDVKA